MTRSCLLNSNTNKDTVLREQLTLPKDIIPVRLHSRWIKFAWDKIFYFLSRGLDEDEYSERAQGQTSLLLGVWGCCMGQGVALTHDSPHYLFLVGDISCMIAYSSRVWGVGCGQLQGKCSPASHHHHHPHIASVYSYYGWLKSWIWSTEQIALKMI